MKLLWLCNMVPGAVKEAITGQPGNGRWVDHVLQDLRRQEDLTIRILCRYSQEVSGRVDGHCSYHTFPAGAPHRYSDSLEAWFAEELRAFAPDVIHSWGVEYAHTLAMVRAAEKTGLSHRMAVSIQGLCGYIAYHYCEGLPSWVRNGFTLRDLLRLDNIARQQKKFFLRGELERQTLQGVQHIIGRTRWDRACTAAIHPEAAYHICNETLRPVFYQGQWEYELCRKHRIFAPGCSYPVKGFHHLLVAFGQIAEKYPDAVISVPDASYLTVSPVRRSSYQKYLAELTRKYGLENRIEFLGSLTAEGMKRAYLEANVFVLPSTIENSPNSLGEAMLLGVPCVAADVGGVTTMLTHDTEGYVYQSTAPYMLAHYLETVFSMEASAADMGQAARHHGRKTHDPEKNLRDLMNIYHEIAR